MKGKIDAPQELAVLLQTRVRHEERVPCLQGGSTYYYANGRPEEEVGDSHSTLFKMCPGEVEQREHEVTFKSVLRAVTPPILVDAYKSLRK
jgi:hypothetical protein